MKRLLHECERRFVVIVDENMCSTNSHAGNMRTWGWFIEPKSVDHAIFFEELELSTWGVELCGSDKAVNSTTAPGTSSSTAWGAKSGRWTKTRRPKASGCS